MRAASYSSFGGPMVVCNVPEPDLGRADAIIEVRATGVCRSDWHGWQGHDADIVRLPHVPGHEFAGVVVDVGADVTRWSVGDQVVVPFVCGCGRCGYCASGNSQVCPDQTQPGFTHWGSFAERVVTRNADFNLVQLPEAVDFATAASLGCRFSTAYRAVVDRAATMPGEWIAVFGCGGVGLSTVMIASALGANAVGIDPRPEARQLALDAGAVMVFDPDEARQHLRELDGDGPHVTVDAVGDPLVVGDAVAMLRRSGRHVQVGLLHGAEALGEVVASRMVAHELTIAGSHGISPAGLQGVLALAATGDLRPDRLIGERVDLQRGAEVLMALGAAPSLGITVITQF